MPKLHARIKHVTHIDPVLVQPQDVIEEPAPDEEGDKNGEEKLRKHRRIETIANQYIKLGRVPLILSAGLRGPFDNGWKNPWGKVPCKTTDEAVPSGGVDKSKSQRSKRVKTTYWSAEQAKAVEEHPASSVPSPEASRGPDAAHDSVLPPDDADDTGATGFFSVDPDPSITFDDLGTPPWLKRPLLVSTALNQSTPVRHDPSPTRARLGDRPVDRRGHLLLATPRQPIITLPSASAQRFEQEPDWLSPASASTGIKSPAQLAQQHPSLNTSGKRKRTYSKYERTRVFENQHTAHSPSTASLSNIVDKDCSDVQHVQVAERQRIPRPELPGATTADAASPSATLTRTSKSVSCEEKVPDVDYTTIPQTFSPVPDVSTRQPPQDAHASADRSSSAAPSLHTIRREKKVVEGATPIVRHDRVTSPTLAASTGFVYRKIGEPKRLKSTAEVKPRPLTFSPSSKVKQHLAEPEEQTEDMMDSIRKQEAAPASELRSKRVDVYDVPGSPQEQQQSATSQRTPDFSTQAALLMAQIDFQDGTMPRITEADTTPWLHAVDSTPHDDPIIPSPAFTPFHKFNATLREESPAESTMQDMPISTQDLFAAVSPFGYSTIKKSTRHTASNMRISVFANDEQDTPSHNNRDRRYKSSTPSQRIPLKAKNTAVSFLGSQSEKGSQEAAMPQLSKAGMATQTANPPRLDVDTSLDDLRRNDDLSFTDRFLVKLNELT